ncbi:MAG: hypothetical protein LBH95_07660 [Oscillospiraceae bacterium]|jgi:hypothetical protein|nr:hypothetical protein [Oscillospiraceae bacterium]
MRIQAKAPPERVMRRLRNACEPWDRAGFCKKDAAVLRTGGSRFALTVNGERGRTHPQRVFRGTVREDGNGGSVIRGRFGMTAADRLLVYLPSQLLLLLAAFLTPSLEVKYAAVLWIAVLLCAFTLIGFLTAINVFTGAERQRRMTDLLQKIGESPR